MEVIMAVVAMEVEMEAKRSAAHSLNNPFPGGMPPETHTPLAQTPYHHLRTYHCQKEWRHRLCMSLHTIGEQMVEAQVAATAVIWAAGAKVVAKEGAAKVVAVMVEEGEVVVMAVVAMEVEMEAS